MPPLKGLAAGSSWQSPGYQLAPPDTLPIVKWVDYCSYRELTLWKNLKVVTQAVHTAWHAGSQQGLSQDTPKHSTRHWSWNTQWLCASPLCWNHLLQNNKWSLLSLVMKEDTRIPRSFQKCKTGSAVKDVEAAAFPWEAANLEVEYGLVSPGAEHELHSSLMGHFLHTSFQGSTAEPLRKSQLKKFCPELSSRFAPSLHSEFYRLLNKDEWISYVEQVEFPSPEKKKIAPLP